jgi:hypothetical protein
MPSKAPLDGRLLRSKLAVALAIEFGIPYEIGRQIDTQPRVYQGLSREGTTSHVSQLRPQGCLRIWQNLPDAAMVCAAVSSTSFILTKLSSSVWPARIRTVCELKRQKSRDRPVGDAMSEKMIAGIPGNKGEEER